MDKMRIALTTLSPLEDNLLLQMLSCQGHCHLAACWIVIKGEITEIRTDRLWDMIAVQHQRSMALDCQL